jgi:hypothetical protein
VIALEALGSFAWRHWKLILGGLVVAGLSVALFLARNDARRAREALTAEKAAHALDIATWRAASAKAIADNIADVRSKETDAAVITEKANHDLESQLADARRLATDYARRVRAAAAGTDQSGPGETRIGEATSTASHPFSAGGVPLLDENDVRVCTDATVKAQGWQTFYASLRERYNTDGTR